MSQIDPHTLDGDPTRRRLIVVIASCVRRCAAILGLLAWFSMGVAGTAEAGCGDHVRSGASHLASDSPHASRDIPSAPCDGPACRRNAPAKPLELPSTIRGSQLREAACAFVADLATCSSSRRTVNQTDDESPHSGFPATIERPPRRGEIL